MEKHDESNNKNVSQRLVADYGSSDSESEVTESRSHTGNDDSDNTELSEMVLKNNIINACAHGPLSTTSDRENVEITRHMIIDSPETDIVEYEVTEYRDIDSDSDSSSSSDDSGEDWIDPVEDGDNSIGDEFGGDKTGKVEPIKALGELGLDDLPPIEDLAISLPSQETTKIGVITSIVDRLVVVRAFPETRAVNLDSVLFLEHGARALGKVFDVFGPVTEPHYCVRFNSQDHVKERGIEPGMEVFIAPCSEHTSYVFVNDLMKVKGSDASWVHDVEPPPSQIDFSDDEEERRAKKANKEQNKEVTENGETSKAQTFRKDNKRNQRPTESSSRFGSGPSRGRNPSTPGSRRNSPWKMWSEQSDTRPPHPNRDAPPHGAHPPFTPPPFNRPLMSFSPFNPTRPPPFMGNSYQFGANPRMRGPTPPMHFPQFGRNNPIFGSSFNNMPGSQPQWISRLPPPPGT
ncbi:unnamed protein product [Parnassius apollo]|uniref:H/ACA ribonucleoprotein complex non-core subunit NAF1 n=1 Tax=Parnassius apollo TaxID=110799 RepID=A0A8S3X0X7_PARAO|nr:unnamed protein product [Parnassius apollo]